MSSLNNLFVGALFFLVCPASFALCTEQDFSGADDGSYGLKNTCSYPINLKYTFSGSKPFSGTYTTLRPGEKTFERAKRDERFRYYECEFPGVPQTLNGGCVGGKNTPDKSADKDATEQAQAAAEAERQQTEADAEARRQQAEIENLVSAAEKSGSLKPQYNTAPSHSISWGDIAVQIQQIQQAQRQSSTVKQGGATAPTNGEGCPQRPGRGHLC